MDSHTFTKAYIFTYMFFHEQVTLTLSEECYILTLLWRHNLGPNDNRFVTKRILMVYKTENLNLWCDFRKNDMKDDLVIMKFLRCLFLPFFSISGLNIDFRDMVLLLFWISIKFASKWYTIWLYLNMYFWFLPPDVIMTSYRK